MEEQEALLSAEETSALMDAMNAGEPSVPAEPIDLGSPERRVREKLLQADKVSESLGDALARTILRHTESVVKVDVAPAELVPFGMLVTTLLPTWSIARMETDASSFALAIGDDQLTSFVLDRRLGAPLSSVESQGEDRLTRAELSPMDRRVLAPVFADIAAVVAKLGADDPDALRLVEVLPNPHSLPPTPEMEPLLLLNFTVQPRNAPAGHLRVVLDASAARRLLPEDADGVVVASPREQHKMRGRILETSIELVAVLGEASANVREILTLRVGDVLRLDAGPHSPVQVRTGDRVPFEGKPCVHHGNLAVRLTRTS
ncbi:MAG: FliM/FliN family flagellar motor switch protein [Myxococcota bacterium]